MESEYATTTSGRQIIVNGDGTWVTSGEPDLASPPTPAVSASDSASASAAASGEATSFRRSSWGDSRAMVVQAEGKDPDRSTPEFIAYETRLAGLGVLSLFTFVGDRLVRGRYAVTEPHTDDNAYLRDFDSLAELLAKKYGDPHDSQTIWHDDLYQDDPSDWGMAVSSGHLVRWHKWTVGGTEVTLILMGDNYEVSLYVDYVSLELGGLENEANESAALEDL